MWVTAHEFYLNQKCSVNRIKATCGLCPLFGPVYPFFDVDVHVRLPIEPVIVRLPLFVRICKANVKEPDDLRNQLIDLAQGDLQSMSALM